MILMPSPARAHDFFQIPVTLVQARDGSENPFSGGAGPLAGP